MSCRSSLNVELEYFPRVLLEYQLLVRIAQPVERFDDVARLVEPPVGPGILHRADAGTLGAEHAPIRAHGLDEQRKRILGVEDRIVIDVPQPLREALDAAAQRARLEPRPLIRDGTSPVRADDAESREILEDG